MTSRRVHVLTLPRIVYTLVSALPQMEVTVGFSEPMFSVVLATFNRADLVMDAVNSVLAQTLNDFELIIVDDRSTDDTLDVLAKIADSRVTVVVNERSKGYAGARNTGILRARARWVCQIDSDDLWPTDMLELMAAAIATAPAQARRTPMPSSRDLLVTRQGPSHQAPCRPRKGGSDGRSQDSEKVRHARRPYA